MPQLPPFFEIAPEIGHALENYAPIVALETTVITHGLPIPENITLAANMEAEVRKTGAIPATIGVLDGKVCVGMTAAQLETLARTSNPRKLSVRDFGMALVAGESGGTTVAGTLLVAEHAGIRVFATGGIGGVHRGSGFDISADLPQLASSPVVVVCAGAKAILDLPATLEYLETVGVPVVGYGTDEFPAFYARSSGLPLTMCADTPQEVARIAKAHWAMGNRSALLLTVPAPTESALPYAEIQVAIDQALAEAEAKHIQGQAVTPFLLQRVSEISGGESLQANLALLLNNAHVAAQVAKALTE
ncbi:MAG: pseudouridine-5'-phosphate glycosidase [Anaerolineales bacterium]|nr:pseudouridine-5'-phosphate glycosidase [Anaerolineales bacterium]